MVEVRTIPQICAELQSYQMARHRKLRAYHATSVLTTINESIAYQVRNLELEFETEIDQRSIYTATGSNLDALVLDRLPEGRLAGQRARGEIRFYRSSPAPVAYTIPLGQVVTAPSSSGYVEFETLEEATIEAGETEVTVSAQAVYPGMEGNIPPYSATSITSPPSGVSYATNPLEFAGGEDEEGDEALRDRYIYSILLPGKATAPMISQHLKDTSLAIEANVETVGRGNCSIIVDCSHESGTVAVIQTTIEENIAGGVVACGCKAAVLQAGTPYPSIKTAWGGKLWIRPNQYVPYEETISGNYVDESLDLRGFSVTIPAYTLEGTAIEVDTGEHLVKEVTSITYAGSLSYDFLIGLGTYPYLFNKPKDVTVLIYARLIKKASFETNLEAKVRESITALISSFKIGDDLEYADIVKAIFVDTNTTHVFEGIDDLDEVYATAKGQTITQFGQKILMDGDEKFFISNVQVE